MESKKIKENEINKKSPTEQEKSENQLSEY